MTTSMLWSAPALGLPAPMLEVLAANNFTNLMPVQKSVLPLFKRNSDLVVEAATGSGKTLAFVVPLLLKLREELPKFKSSESELKFIRYLVIAPTREICLQTQRVFSLFETIDQFKGQAGTATGGRPIEQDTKLVEDSPPVLIATVGRLNQLLEKEGSSFLRKVDVLVVDEADRALKQKGLPEVMAALPKQRRTYLFSATLQDINSEEGKVFGLRNAMKVVVRAKTAQEGDKLFTLPSTLHNQYVAVSSREDKLQFLINFMMRNRDKKLLVFFNTCAAVAFYERAFHEVVQLRQLGIKAIHGRMKQNRRHSVIEAFVTAPKGILFGTDVVARGIDFKSINYIVQVDPPVDPASFVHRIGRTARVSSEGHAIVLLEPVELGFIEFLKLKGVQLQQIEPPQPYKWKFEWARQMIWNAMAEDQDIILKSKQAFVSFVRAFKEHQLKYIFEFKKLDLGKVANSFFLFRVPRVKEILGQTLDSFVGTDLDPKTVPFKNKNQEKMINQRVEQHRLQAEEELEKAKAEGQSLSQKRFRQLLRKAGRIKELSSKKKLREDKSQPKKVARERREAKAAQKQTRTVQS